MKISQLRSSIILLCLITSASIELQSQSAFPTGYGWVVPRVSQPAKVYQKVGVTEIEVNYSRPYTKGRQVWENARIAPYDKVWRAGANEATTISFSTDVQIAGENLPAGKYAFFLIPKEKEAWTVIFNTVHSQWGAFTYDETKDALRVDIAPEADEHIEAVEYSFPELSAENAVMSLRWGKVRLDVPISVDGAQTAADLANRSFDWQAGFFAAQYFIDKGTRLTEGLRWAEASIAMKENYSNLNQKLTILEMLESLDEAKKVAEYILTLTEGKDDNASKYFKKAMEEKIKNWGQ